MERRWLLSGTELLFNLLLQICPPHGAKQATGTRSEMEDSYIAIPNFLHVQMQDDPDPKVGPLALSNAAYPSHLGFPWGVKHKADNFRAALQVMAEKAG